MTSPLAATLGSSGGIAAVSQILGVLVWRCRARLPNVLGLFLKFFDDCSYAGHRLSRRDRAIIRELSEIVFGLKISWRLAALVILSHAKRCGTPYCPQTCHHQHFTVSIMLFLTSDRQVGLSPARQLFGEFSRVAALEVMR